MSATGNRLDKIETVLGDTVAPPCAEDFNATLESIIAERGGASAFSPAQLAAARRLARLLTDEGRVDAPGISVLLTMLPPPRPAAPAWDLSVLTVDELREFGRLIHKASGTPWSEAADASSSAVNS
jgi:hypothetical protein